MEEEINQLGDLTVSAILKDALGSEKSGQILSDIQYAIDKDQLRGDDLKKRIYEILCRYEVNDIEVHHVLLRGQVIIT